MHVAAPLLAFGLSYHGHRKGSLSLPGALTAFVVGTISMGMPLRVFGVQLILFYLAGSRATKVGKARKANLEEGHAEAGNRNGWQVLCNSFTAVVICITWFILISSETPTIPSLRPFLSSSSPSSPSSCSAIPSSALQISRALLFSYLGHYATCMGDTLASELGILSSSPPRLVTAPWRHVPPGTNGGMSLTGTLASLFGGTFMGVVLWLGLWEQGASCFANGASISKVVAVGAFSGLLGSLLDSLLGATLQQTRYSTDTKLILTDESQSRASTSARLSSREIQVVSGLDILTNNQVNFLSSLFVAGIVGLGVLYYDL